MISDPFSVQLCLQELLRSARVEGSAYAKKSARYESASQDYDQFEESQQIDV